MIAAKVNEPRRLAFISTFLFLLAFTKFRRRDTFTAVTQVDLQIVFELACYGVLAIIALYLLRLVVVTQPHIPFGWIEIFIFAYVLFSVVSVVWSLNRPLTVVRSFQLVITALIPWLFYRLMAIEAYWKVIARAIVVYCCLFAGLALIFPWADGTLVTWTGERRFSWFALHPGVVSDTATIGFLLLLFGWVSQKHKRGWVLTDLATLGFLTVLVALLIASYSRGSTIALVFSVGVFFLLTRRNLSFRLYSCALFLCVSLIFATTLPAYLSRIGTFEGQPIIGFLLRGQNTEQFLSLSGRTGLWEDAAQLIASDPLAGTGYGAARTLLLGSRAWAAEAHNAYFEVALSLGVLGVFLLLFPILSVYVATLSRLVVGSFRGPERYRVATISAMLSYFLVYSVVSTTFAYAGYDLDSLITFSALFGYVQYVRSHNLPKPYAGAGTSKEGSYF